MKPELYGHTAGLSPQSVRSLERLYRRRVPEDVLYTPELMRHLLEASMLAHRQVGVLVHRSGAVEYVLLGDASKIELPDLGRHRAAEGRFRGLRLVHTHIHGEDLTKDDIVDLVRLRLDLVCALSLTPEGELHKVTYAYNVPGVPGEAPYRLVGPMQPWALDVHPGELVRGLEAELARRRRGREVTAKDGRAILVHVGINEDARLAKADADTSMRELVELARTAGVQVVHTETQIRQRLDARYVMGRGKLEDVVLRAAELDADVLVFDRNLSPAQAAAVAKLSDLKVIDRTQLILDIFAQRAESKDGKLQVELAQLKYALPRLGQKDDSLSRLTGGIGGRGPGETTLEIGRRRARDRVTHLESELKDLAKHRAERRRRRARAGVPSIAIVGYTNAGKSTLLRALTGADVMASNQLFATLETRSRMLKVGFAGYGGREVIVTDTVGFIRDLPKDLLAAFRATFEEAADADLLIHVVDASDRDWSQHVRATDDLLEDLGLGQVPCIIVFNKWDAADEKERGACRRGEPNAIPVSALDRDSVVPVIAAIATALQSRWDDAATVPTYELEHSQAERSDAKAGEASSRHEP